MPLSKDRRIGFATEEYEAWCVGCAKLEYALKLGSKSEEACLVPTSAGISVAVT
jgi:hypothetical protein